MFLSSAKSFKAVASYGYRSHRRLLLPFFTVSRSSPISHSHSKDDDINGITSDAVEAPPLPPPMANLYCEWSLEQDCLLWWNHKEKSTAELASLLGRGIRGVEARLSKLQDVSSPAYERLFASTNNKRDDNDHDDASNSGNNKEKLVPVGEVLRRIEWDQMLPTKDFSILHYDRVQDQTMESPVDAPNTSVSGKATLLIKALPEHRIVGVKYKERIVWDRNARLDLVFNEPGIYHVMETYDQWKEDRDRVQSWNRERQKAVAERIQRILGVEHYGELQQLSSNLIQAEQDPTLSTKTEVEWYVQQALELFRAARANTEKSQQQSLEPWTLPRGDYDALDELSELVSVLPNVELRGLLLIEIALAMARAKGKARGLNPAKLASTPASTSNLLKATTVELVEDELIESFVRGSGPGGQKVNKTSNRVVLIHEPTQLRVECQETRSLQQNRKIARKRLAEKLDDYLNGNQSKVSLKVQKTIDKKQKQKSKNRARLKKKQLEKHLEQLEQQSTSSDEHDFY
jgi:uncharacterized protein (UPF0248 family)